MMMGKIVNFVQNLIDVEGGLQNTNTGGFFDNQIFFGDLSDKELKLEFVKIFQYF